MEETNKIEKSNEMENEPLFLEGSTITNCPRCGKTHLKVTFNKFTQNMIINIGIGEIMYNYWALCPILHEPIVITVKFEKEEKTNG